MEIVSSWFVLFTGFFVIAMVLHGSFTLAVRVIGEKEWSLESLSEVVAFIIVTLFLTLFAFCATGTTIKFIYQLTGVLK